MRFSVTRKKHAMLPFDGGVSFPILRRFQYVADSLLLSLLLVLTVSPDLKSHSYATSTHSSCLLKLVKFTFSCKLCWNTAVKSLAEVSCACSRVLVSLILPLSIRHVSDYVNFIFVATKKKKTGRRLVKGMEVVRNRDCRSLGMLSLLELSVGLWAFFFFSIMYQSSDA